MTFVRSLPAPTCLWALLVLWPALAACPGDARRPLGASCTDDSQCAAGQCIAQLCLDPDGDEDRDGLVNQLEGALGSNPLAADTDADGMNDGAEVGVDLANPADADGDGKVDAIESDRDDADRDCVVDQADPFDGRPETDPTALARLLCLRAGACGAAAAVITATCDGAGAAACDYQGVPGFEASEVSCDGVDNDCDGATDEHHAEGGDYTYDGGPYPADAGKALGAGCGVGACAGGTVICGPDMARLTCSTAGRAGPLTCSADMDCDGLPDETEVPNPIVTPLAGCKDYFADADRDGYGAGAPRCLCTPFGDYKVENRDDCAETEPLRHPLADGICGVDADCDKAALDVGEICDDANLEVSDGCHACQAVARRIGGVGSHPGSVTVAGLNGGGFVIGWDEGPVDDAPPGATGPPALAGGVRLGRSLRFFSAAGREIGREDGLGKDDLDFSAAMQAAALPDGVALGAWRFLGAREPWVYEVQEYSEAGARVGAPTVVHTSAQTGRVSLVSTVTGRVALVTPTSDRTAGSRIAVVYLERDGAVSAGAGRPAVGGAIADVEALGLGDDTLAILWSEYDPASFTETRYTQRFDTGGAPIGEPRPFDVGGVDLRRAHLARRNGGWAVYFLGVRYLDDVPRNVIGRLAFNDDTPGDAPAYLDEEDLAGCPYDFAAGFDASGNAWTALTDDECGSPARAWFKSADVREITLLDAALHPGATSRDLAADSSGLGFVAAFVVGGDAAAPGVYLVRIGGEGLPVYVPGDD